MHTDFAVNKYFWQRGGAVTDYEWKRIETALRKKIVRLRNRAKYAIQPAFALERMELVRKLEDRLRKHRRKRPLMVTE